MTAVLFSCEHTTGPIWQNHPPPPSFLKPRTVSQLFSLSKASRYNLCNMLNIAMLHMRRSRRWKECALLIYSSKRKFTDVWGLAEPKFRAVTEHWYAICVCETVKSFIIHGAFRENWSILGRFISRWGWRGDRSYSWSNITPIRAKPHSQSILK